MPAASARIASIGLAVAASALSLSACSAGVSPTPGATTASSSPVGDAYATGDSTAAATSDAASDPMYGCTDAILSFANDHGYPDAVPQPPGTMMQLGGQPVLTATPICVIEDENGGAPRFGAFFPADVPIHNKLAAALAAGGYMQSDNYGTNVWWINGDSPTSAEHAVSYAPQSIGDMSVNWLVW
ncbi:hypothetical protein ABCS02_22990 [Microbacterium sp. X-17]|uniref:hypothetical protein n=1 Tax=Microbacterium sp. X-17 TaxID=3144404 RepID=UPI0031F4F5D5